MIQRSQYFVPFLYVRACESISQDMSGFGARPCSHMNFDSAVACFLFSSLNDALWLLCRSLKFSVQPTYVFVICEFV